MDRLAVNNSHKANDPRRRPAGSHFAFRRNPDSLDRENMSRKQVGLQLTFVQPCGLTA
jgi:hypothetical protein